jgi:gliding motility-associated-like protein
MSGLNINEARSVCSSPNGNYYYLTLDSMGSVTPGFTFNFQRGTTYNFAYGSPSFSPTNQGMNAMAATSSFIYVQNGDSLYKRDISTGAIINAVAIPGGINNVIFFFNQNSPGNSGIDIDSCGNIYVGSSNQLVKYDGNLNLLSTVSTQAAVYDVRVNNNGEVVVCGDGFAQSIPMSACAPRKQICVSCPTLSIDTSNVINETCFGQSIGGFTVTTTDGTSPYSYVLLNSTLNIVATFLNVNGSQNFTGLSAGTYTLNVLDSNNCPGTITINITQPAQVIPTITGQTSVCVGGTDTLVASVGYATYLWSNAATTQSIIVTTTGTYYVTVTNSSGCTGTDSIAITVNNGISPIITGALSFCTGSFTTLNVGSGYTTYLWSTSATVDTIHVTSGGIYSVTVTNSQGCTGSASVTVTESSNLTPVITGNTLLCMGGASILDAGNGYSTYQWSTSATTEAITVTMIGPYYVTVTNSSGCTGTDSIFVTQLAPINPTLTGSTSLCIGDTSILKAGQGFVSYLWSNAATTDTLIVTASGTYTVTVTDANGCTGSASITVTFYPSAVTAFTADTLNGCAPFTVQFNNTTTNAATYLWNFGDGNTSTLTNPSHTYLTSGNYTVTLIGYGAGGCNDTLIRTTYIHVITPPALTDSFTVSPASGCVGELISFTNHSNNATSYIWNFGDGNTSTATNPTHTYSLLGTYYVTLYSINNTVCGVMIDSSKIQVIIYPNAIAAFNTPDTGGCPPYIVTFNNGSTLSSSYSWNFGDGNTSTSTNPTYTYTNPGFYTVTLIAFGQNGCNDTLTLSNYIDVYNPGVITAQFHSDTLTGCNPFTVDFINTSINGSTYLWRFGDNATDTSHNPIHTYIDSGSYSVTLIVYNTANGCVSIPDSITLTDYINVVNPPVVTSNFSGNPLVGCMPLLVNFTNLSANANFYYWSFGDGFTDTARNPSHTYLDSGIYNVFLIVADTGSVCKAKQDTIILKDYVNVEFCELYIPNVFSPNGDEYNDFFKIISSGYTDYHVTIFNRWGEKVFDNTNPSILWNGKINGNGSDASDGTYYYILNVKDPNGKSITRKGSLTLIR